jgi:hypothetical protein
VENRRIAVSEVESNAALPRFASNRRWHVYLSVWSHTVGGGEHARAAMDPGQPGVGSTADGRGEGEGVEREATVKMDQSEIDEEEGLIGRGAGAAPTGVVSADHALTGLLGLAHEHAAAGGSDPALGQVTPRLSDELLSGRSGAVDTSMMTGASSAATSNLINRTGMSPSRKDRLERNRTAAQQCRKRKKEYVKRIEEEVAELRAENWRLRTTVATAATENELLRRENEMYRQIVQGRAAPTLAQLPGLAAAVAAAGAGAGAGVGMGDLQPQQPTMRHNLVQQAATAAAAAAAQLGQRHGLGELPPTTSGVDSLHQQQQQQQQQQEQELAAISGAAEAAGGVNAV